MAFPPRLQAREPPGERLIILHGVNPPAPLHPGAGGERRTPVRKVSSERLHQRGLVPIPIRTVHLSRGPLLLCPCHADVITPGKFRGCDVMRAGSCRTRRRRRLAGEGEWHRSQCPRAPLSLVLLPQRIDEPPS